MARSQDDDYRSHTSNTISSGVIKRTPRTNARPWTQEEKEYLLQARYRAMPYKQIAIHLQKTELACRLHYHQMKFGAHRLQSSLVDGARIDPSHGARLVDEGTLSGQENDAITGSHSPCPRSCCSSPPALTSTKTLMSPASTIDTDWKSPQSNQQPQSGTDVSRKGIGGAWQHTAMPVLAPPSAFFSTPDLSRLFYDYADNNRAFWSNVASQFSQSPAELEAAFRAILNRQSSSLSAKPDERSLAPLDWTRYKSANEHQRSTFELQTKLDDKLVAPSPKRFTVSSLLS